MVTEGERWGRVNWELVIDIYTTSYKTDNQQGSTV